MHGKTGLYVTFLLAASIASTGMAGAYEGYISYINDYQDPDSDLPECEDNANNIRDELNAEGTYTVDKYGETNAKESHWKSGGDSSYADWGDLSYFCGHGGTYDAGDQIRSFQAFTPQGGESEYLYGNELNLGDTDAEWATFDSSHSLYIDDENNLANLAEWHSGFDYLNLLIGWHTSPADTDTGGEFYDSMFDTGSLDGGGEKIKASWFASDGGCSGNSGEYQTIIGEKATFGNDHAWSEGGPAAGSQANDGSYVYWGNSC